MPKLSAGILLARVVTGGPEFLLVHPGGPFWRNKDVGAWSIPKGEHGPSDDPMAAALREFQEELGVPCPGDPLLPLGSVRQAGGKVVTAWCTIGEIDTDAIVSNTFDVEWPPRSGRMQSFPEVDRAAFFTAEDARTTILGGQVELIDRAIAALHAAGHV